MGKTSSGKMNDRMGKEACDLGDFKKHVSVDGMPRHILDVRPVIVTGYVI